MFGVTTPLVTRLVAELAGRFDPLVFHATGTGGQSMEKLVDSGLIVGVLDMTTTEVADLRRRAASSRPGPTASVRSPAPECPTSVRSAPSTWSTSAPSTRCRHAFADRNLFHVHNPQVTLMRTTVGRERRHRRVHRRQAQRLSTGRSGSCCPKAACRCSTPPASRSTTPRPTRPCSPRSKPTW